MTGLHLATEEEVAEVPVKEADLESAPDAGETIAAEEGDNKAEADNEETAQEKPEATEGNWH